MNKRVVDPGNKQDTRLRISIIEGCDYESFPTGGVLPFLQNSLRYRPRAELINLVGLTTRTEEEIGKWQERKVGEDIYPFMPVAFCSRHTSEHPSLVPNRAKMLFGLMLHMYKIIRVSDIIYVHSPELALPFICFGRNRELVIHLHGIPDYAAINSRYPWIRNGLIAYLYSCTVRAVLRRADKLIWVSQDGLNGTRRRRGIPEKSVVIPTSVDLELFKPMDNANLKIKYNLRTDMKFVGFLGRLNNSKHPQLLLNAFKYMTNVRNDVGIVYIGDGELRHDLQSEVRRLGLTKRVLFLGKIAHDLIAECINLVDVGCFPSKTGKDFRWLCWNFLHVVSLWSPRK